MHGSIYSNAVDAARAKATELGHRLGKTDVAGCAARAACGTCGSSLTVMFHSPIVTLGNAVDMPCKQGELNATPPTQPATPTGKVKRIPVPRPGKPVALQVPASDDVPWPTDAPARDTAMTRAR